MKLCIPEKILEQHAIWLGKTRAGKSSSMRHVVEWLLEQNQRLCIVDPKGDWYGLKLSADGKSAGYKVILFGDFKEATATDVPINDRSGRHIAELIASGNRPCVIGMRGWSNAAQSRFWIDFASALFNSNLTGGLKLFVDEVQNFAPKERTGLGQENEALFWTKKLLSEGSGLGLTIFCGSQRPASVHNGVLTQCETLVAMRVIHSSDRKASKEWIDGNGDKELGQKVLDSLAGLSRGEAYVWSPECEFGPEKVQFPMFTTFDSFAPPQAQKKISTQGWSTVNLDDVKAKLATVIAEAKANDPAELKKEIARLQKEVSVKQKIKAVVEEVPTFTNSDAVKIAKVVQRLDEVERMFERGYAKFPEIKDLLSKITQPSKFIPAAKPMLKLPVAIIRRPATVAPPSALGSGDSGEVVIGKCERAILTALAQYPQGRSAVQVALLSEYSVNSGGFNNSLGKLRSIGFITRNQPIQIKPEGLAALGDFDPLPTGVELAHHWIAKLPKCEAAILKFLVDNHPNKFVSQSVADEVGYSANSGGFNNSLGRLRTLELITRGQPMKATDEFFQ